MSDQLIYKIFESKIIAKLSYASPAWWGFCSSSTKEQLEAFLRRAMKFNYYPRSAPTFTQIVEKLEYSLFRCITSNENHCLYSLLPPLKTCNYNLRKRGHSYLLPNKDDRNFINRCLFKYL